MVRIQHLHALEILDSRGRPTLQVECRLEDGTCGVASIPSGASTGRWEAHELRDQDPKRYRGLGCLTATANVNTTILEHLRGRDWSSQQELDTSLIRLDGTPAKSRLGANALLGTSIAFARACSISQGLELYEYFALMLEKKPERLPRPTINLFSGGKHAGAQVPVQDVLIVPADPTIAECLETTYTVYQCAAELSHEQYGMRALSADEGGLAPPFPNAETMFEDALRAIERAGRTPGQDVFLAVDVASSHFYQDGIYDIGLSHLDSATMADYVARWVDRFPIISVEDALAEDDWDAWPLLYQAIHEQALVLGDDLLCTNTERIRKAQETASANALLLKVNQIGTLSEAMQANNLARSRDWHVTVSARSGETEDNWLADLSVGWSGDQIKVGSITQSERLAKYNRLLHIEEKTGFPVVPWPEKA